MQSLERMQTLLEFGSFEFQLIFLDEAAVDGKIVLVPEQQGGGFFAVASRATGLLRIIIQANKRRMVDNEADVGNVDTQTEGVGGHHHLYLSACKALQTGRLVLTFAVVKLRLKTCARCGCDFRVRGTPPQPQRVFDAAGLPQVIVFERGE